MIGSEGIVDMSSGGGNMIAQGEFEDGCVGEWAEDAAAIISGLTDGPQILVGSSMGGWISLLLAREMSERQGQQLRRTFVIFQRTGSNCRNPSFPTRC